MKDDVSAAARGPADGFRIAPAFVTDDDAELQWADFENLAVEAGREEFVFRWIELHFVLKAGDGPIGIDYERGDAEAAIDKAFSAENDRDIGARGGCLNDGRGSFEKCGVGRRDGFAEEAVARYEAFGETNDAGAFGGSRGDGAFSERDGFFRRCGEAKVGERDAKGAHGLGILRVARVKDVVVTYSSG